MRFRHLGPTMCCLILMSTSVIGQEYATDKDDVAAVIGKQEYPPYAGREFPTPLLWGETHLHTALTAVEEENFFGKHSGVEPEPHRWEHVVIEAPDPEFSVKGWQQAAAGRAAVWARENTRGAIFDAMLRKEVYATTGSRITVRFFGGWDFESADAQTRIPAAVGYAKGVHMGGDLRAAPAGAAPTSLVAALKDPMSGNLDRIQIIKGWMDGAASCTRRSTTSCGAVIGSVLPTASSPR